MSVAWWNDRTHKKIIVPLRPQIFWPANRPRAHKPKMAISLGEGDIDNLLYFARAGETEGLKDTLVALETRHNASALEILLAAVDAGSGNGPLHMASANGHVGK